MARNSYPWSRIVADARQRDGDWLIPSELVAVPFRVLQGIRLKRHPDLIADDGYLEPKASTTWTDEDGRKLATIFVRFVRYPDDMPPPGAERRT